MVVDSRKVFFQKSRKKVMAPRVGVGIRKMDISIEFNDFFSRNIVVKMLFKIYLYTVENL